MIFLHANVCKTLYYLINLINLKKLLVKFLKTFKIKFLISLNLNKVRKQIFLMK